MRAAKRWTFLFLGLVLSLGGAAGCKQGLGDRCQINDDCEAGLSCSTGMTHVCVPTTAPDAAVVGIDAMPAPDAPVVSGPDAPPPPDAAVDAPVAPPDV
jgi:hypothetical protein